MSIFLTKITAKLILNVAYHGWETKKFFHSRLPKTALCRIFLTFYLTEKMNCIKELCQKSFINILNYIMQNYAYMQEKITSVKTLQIKLLPLSAAMLFTLRSVLHVKYSLFRKQTAIKSIAYCHQTIKLAVGTIVESLHTWLKTSLEISVLILT